MNYVTFTRNARTLTRTQPSSGSSIFTDQMIVDFVNLSIEELAGDIVKADESALQMTAYTNLVADQRVYELPSNMLNRMVKLEIKLNGTNWSKAEEVDFNRIDTPVTTETDIRANFNDDPVLFSLYRQSFNIWSGSPIISVSQGLRLYYNINPHTWVTGDLVSTNDISLDLTATDVGFPSEFHPVLLYKVTRRYKTSRDKPIPLDYEEQNIDLLFQQALSNYRNANRDRKTAGAFPKDYGYSY